MKITNYILIFLFLTIFTNCKNKTTTKTENLDNLLAFDFTKDLYQSFDTLKTNSDAFTKIEDTIYKFNVFISNENISIDNIANLAINKKSKILLYDNEFNFFTLKEFEKQFPVFLNKLTRKNFVIQYENDTNIKNRLKFLKIIFTAINEKNDFIANKLFNKDFEKLNSKEKELLEETFYTCFLFNNKKPIPIPLPLPPENLR